MIPKPILPLPMGLAVLALGALIANGYGASVDSVSRDGRRTVAVLDPVELTTQNPPGSQKPPSEWGDILRRCFASRPIWKVVGRDSMRAKEKEFGFVSYRGCHEFQCAFDAGNVFAAEYVLFSSISRLGGTYVYTLNLVHVPSSQTVWSRVGEAGVGEDGNPGARLENAWANLIGRLAPEKAPVARRVRLGQITILDLSLGRWAPAQATVERIATHLNAVHAFDIMGSKEQDELVGALGIDKAAFIPTDSAVFELGGKMGVSHLVSSRLVEDRGHAFRLELGFYDIAGHKKVKAGRSENAQDIVEALRFETAFFSSLFPIEPDGEDGLPAPRSHGLSRAIGTAGVATGIACGIMAYRFDQASHRKNGQIVESRSRESALLLRDEAAMLERRSLLWGASGLAGLLAGAAVLTFSF